MLATIKRQLLNTWSSIPLAPDLFAPLLRGRATIFMLHRFSDPERSVRGHDPAALGRALAYFRKHEYELVALDQLFTRLAGEGPPPNRAVAFTIDDGYYDHATIAAPVFAEYDCPVTTFVTTGFLDGDLWCWWDRIEFVLQTTQCSSVIVTVGEVDVEYRLNEDRARFDAQCDFIARCKTVSEAEKLAAIDRLADAAHVSLPERSPPRYAPMTWDQLRSSEDKTMTFGPHTVTHPILSRTPDEQARREVVRSWSRLCEEAANPVPVFCYPNGQPGDFGAREIAILQDTGLVGAVVGSPGYAHTASYRANPSNRFAVRRFVWPNEFQVALQYASGLERMKQVLRREVAA